MRLDGHLLTSDIYNISYDSYMAILSSEIVAIFLPLHMHLLCTHLSTRQQL